MKLLVKTSLLALSLFILILLNSCTTADNSNPVSTIHGNVGEIIVPDEAYKYIGYGYDLTDNYADPMKVKGMVFKSYALPDYFTKRTKIENTIFAVTSGSSISEYQSKLTTNVDASGSYKLFSGAVKTDFSEEFYSINQSSFSTVMCKVNKYQIAVTTSYARADSLREYMDEQAEKDLNDSSIAPNVIFSKYGTHVMTGAVMGARLDFNGAIMSSYIKTDRSIDILSQADYKSMFSSADISIQFNSDQEKSDYLSHRELKLKAFGGLSEYSTSIVTNDDYNKWINSIDGNEVFCDYTSQGLIPIWEFCIHQDRQAELMNAYPAYVASRQIQTHDSILPRQCIIDITVLNYNRGDFYDENGLRYYKLDHDLNCGARGDFVYIYYATGMSNTTGNFSPITNLHLSHSSKESKAKASVPYYDITGNDLNSGAGGEFIYLFKSRDKRFGRPITGIEVEDRSKKTSYFSNKDIQTGYNYFDSDPSPLDVNKGAGGNFIYLYWTSD